jgi:hypothetical protein
MLLALREAKARAKAKAGKPRQDARVAFFVVPGWQPPP